MAFPNTPILDSAVRADQSPATGWTDGPDGTAYGNLQILSNKLAPISGDAWSYFTGAGPFTRNLEAYRTVDVATSQHTIDLLESIGAGVDGYTFSCAGSGSASATLERIDNNVNTVLGATITLSAALTAADGIGVDRVNGVIGAYHRIGAGSFSSVATRSDSTYTGASYVALYMFNAAGRTSNVGGGAVPSGGLTTLGAGG